MEGGLQGDEIIYMIALGIAIMLAFALAFVGFFYFSQQRILKEKNTQQALKLEHQAALLYNNIMTQEKERARIAKDLHDEVGSKLNVIFLNLHRLKKAESNSPQFGEAWGDIKSVLNQTISTTRQISHNLLPPTLKGFGLIAAINELCEYYTRSEIVKINVQVHENTPSITDKMVELNIFRVVQELIKNSIVHGKAKQIDIEIGSGEIPFTLAYKDNGIGFNADAIKLKKTGLGMQNIESRMNMIGATFDFDAAVGAGFEFRLLFEPKN